MPAGNGYKMTVKRDRKKKREFFLLALCTILISLISLLILKNKASQNELATKYETHLVQDNHEACLSCHKDHHGFSKSHAPEALGCSTCHLGNPFSTNKEAAHKNLVSIPGNLKSVNQSCGSTSCHNDLTERIHDSLMATAKGIVSVNRFVFGEAATPDGPGNLAKLGESTADSHLRHLCASCHLQREKLKATPVTERSRGGGCLACHLRYNKESKEALSYYQKSGQLKKAHPELTVQVEDRHCFGCHSRSGRISTNFEGWHETMLKKDELHESEGYRLLEDGRVFKAMPADVHHKAGLSCIDCHTWRETMGDGKLHNHQDEQVEISCSDCHRKKENQPEWIKRSELHNIEHKLLELRSWKEQQRFLKIEKSAKALINITEKEDGSLSLREKNNNKLHPMKAPASLCTLDVSGHERLSCQSCHTAWAPQCISCHVSFDPNQNGFDHQLRKKTPGRWLESRDYYFAEAPTLGIRKTEDIEKIEPFVPGMVLSIDTGSFEGQKNKPEIFKRLFAPAASHTTAKAGRSCESCHQSSLALGYGRGTLNFPESAAKNKALSFTPSMPLHSRDNLPLDAWIPFMGEGLKPHSTRSNTRPFTIEEQQRILEVGQCLKCHPADKDKKLYEDFSKSLTSLSDKCTRLFEKN